MHEWMRGVCGAALHAHKLVSRALDQVRIPMPTACCACCARWLPAACVQIAGQRAAQQQEAREKGVAGKLDAIKKVGAPCHCSLMPIIVQFNSIFLGQQARRHQEGAPCHCSLMPIILRCLYIFLGLSVPIFLGRQAGCHQEGALCHCSLMPIIFHCLNFLAFPCLYFLASKLDAIKKVPHATALSCPCLFSLCFFSPHVHGVPSIIAAQPTCSGLAPSARQCVWIHASCLQLLIAVLLLPGLP